MRIFTNKARFVVALSDFTKLKRVMVFCKIGSQLQRLIWYLRPVSGCTSGACDTAAAAAAAAAEDGDGCLGLLTLVLLLANSSLMVCGKSGSNRTPCCKVQKVARFKSESSYYFDGNWPVSERKNLKIGVHHRNIKKQPMCILSALESLLLLLSYLRRREKLWPGR